MNSPMTTLEYKTIFDTDPASFDDAVNKLAVKGWTMDKFQIVAFPNNRDQKVVRLLIAVMARNA